MNKTAALIVAGIIFGLVSIAHLWRIIYQIDIQAAGHVVPMMVSYVGFPVTLALSIWMFVSSKK